MQINWEQFDEEVLSGVDLCKKINSFGYEAYIVGGCVRDIVKWVKAGSNGEPSIHDVDIATNMPIDELYSNFKCESNNGEEHGTILVFNDGIAFEVTQFRVDGEYTDGRHPDSVKFTKSFKDDTSRRDFTINAMGIDADGNLIDYHGGEQDLENKVLRTVGKPEDRFNEDALRIIRAIRFAARFDMDIDEDTYDAICNLKGNIKGLAMERISAELKKSIEYGVDAFANVINVLVKTGACDYIDDKYIDWNYLNKALNIWFTRGIDIDKDVMTCMALVLLCANDEKSMDLACKHLRLETDMLKLAKLYNNSEDIIRSLDKNLVKSVKLVNDKNFNRILELAKIFGIRINMDHLRRIEDLIDNELPKQKEISTQIASEGVSGVNFGIELNKRMEELYRKAF